MLEAGLRACTTLPCTPFLCVADTFWSVHTRALVEGRDLCECCVRVWLSSAIVCITVCTHSHGVQVCVLWALSSHGKPFHGGQCGAGCCECTLILTPAVSRCGLHTVRAQAGAEDFSATGGEVCELSATEVGEELPFQQELREISSCNPLAGDLGRPNNEITFIIFQVE